MSKRSVRIAAALLVATYALAHFAGHAHSQSSLGIGASEPAITPEGPLAGLLQWISVQQQAFYRSLTDALKEMRDGGGGLWILVGLSLAYGVFHAAGPGHGKAVISSYMLANEVALRRGVLLSFAASAVQAVSAIVLMTAVFLVLRGTSISMTDAAQFLETMSFALVAAFGAWLLWRKLAPLVRPATTSAPMHSLSAAHAGEVHSHGHEHHAHHHHEDDHHHHNHADGGACPTCGRSHAPDPTMLAGDRFGWRTAISAVAAVGMRPCSGALIVLTFAFLNGLWWGGVLSVFAMALGTAITVSALAVLAVTAKNWAVAVAGGGAWSTRLHTGIEIAGALLILVLGLMLFAASISG